MRLQILLSGAKMTKIEVGVSDEGPNSTQIMINKKLEDIKIFIANSTV